MSENIQQMMERWGKADTAKRLQYLEMENINLWIMIHSIMARLMPNSTPDEIYAEIQKSLKSQPQSKPDQEKS